MICCDESKEGLDLLDRYKKGVNSLSKLCIEMFGENKQLLLSPILREMVLEQAKDLDGLHLKIKHNLHIDWPVHLGA